MSKIIALTSAGGGGHNAALDAISIKGGIVEKELVVQDITDWMTYSAFGRCCNPYRIGYLFMSITKFFTRMFQGYGLDEIGKEGISQWNKAQQEGDLAKLRRLISQQDKAAAIFGGEFAFQLANLIEKNSDCKEIWITQAQCNHVFLRVIDKINQQRLAKGQEAITVKLYFTDIPSKTAVHFLSPLQKLTKRDLRNTPFHLYTPRPYLENKHVDPEQEIRKLLPFLDDAKFYEEQSIKNVKENTRAIIFTDGPINQAFLKHTERKQVENDFHVISLGSKPSIAGIEACMQAYDEHYRHNSVKDIVYVLCCDDSGAIEVVKTFNDTKKSNLTFIPLPRQKPEEMSGLFTNAKSLIVRPGGMTCMEVAKLATGHVYGYSELPKGRRDFKGNTQREALYKEYVSCCETEELAKSDLLPWEASNLLWVGQQLQIRAVQDPNLKLLNLKNASQVFKEREFDYKNSVKVKEYLEEIDITKAFGEKAQEARNGCIVAINEICIERNSEDFNRMLVKLDKEIRLAFANIGTMYLDSIASSKELPFKKNRLIYLNTRLATLYGELNKQLSLRSEMRTTSIVDLKESLLESHLTELRKEVSDSHNKYFPKLHKSRLGKAIDKTLTAICDRKTQHNTSYHNRIGSR